MDATPQPRKLRTAYWIGDIVYLRVRGERVRGMVTTVNVYSNGHSYGVTWGSDAQEVSHQEMELTNEFVLDFGVTPEDAS